MKRCSRKHFCIGLTSRLNSKQNDHGKGLAVFVLMNMRTGKDTVHGVTYRVSAADRGVLLNYCPWCGNRVDFIVQDEKKRVAKKKRKP